MRIVTILAVLLILAGAVLIIYDRSPGADIPLLVGLFTLFVANSKTKDERLMSIKMSSAYIALILGYGFKLVSSNLFSHQVISWQLTDINYFLILVFAVALIIYYSRLYFTSH